MNHSTEISEIENIEIVLLTMDDYPNIKSAMLEAYPNMKDSYWRKSQIQTLIEKFPEGQVGIKINGELAGCALSIIVDYEKFKGKHTYKQITGE